MVDALIRTMLVLPLVAGLAFASLWAWRRYQLGLGSGASERSIAVVDSLSLGPANRLVVVEFGDRHILLSVGKQGVATLAESEHG